MKYNPDQIVRLNVIGEVTHFGMDEKCRPALVQIDEQGVRFVTVKAGFAHQLLCSGAPSSWPLREANEQLAAALGPLKPEPGINLRAFEEAQYAAMRPPSKSELVGETLAMYRGATGYDI